LGQYNPSAANPEPFTVRDVVVFTIPGLVLFTVLFAFFFSLSSM
jgi:hypothetical protein